MRRAILLAATVLLAGCDEPPQTVIVRPNASAPAPRAPMVTVTPREAVSPTTLNVAPAVVDIDDDGVADVVTVGVAATGSAVPTSAVLTWRLIAPSSVLLDTGRSVISLPNGEFRFALRRDLLLPGSVLETVTAFPGSSQVVARVPIPGASLQAPEPRVPGTGLFY